MIFCQYQTPTNGWDATAQNIDQIHWRKMAAISETNNKCWLLRLSIKFWELWFEYRCHGGTILGYDLFRWASGSASVAVFMLLDFHYTSELAKNQK